jgi:hypothetical protein
MLGSLQICGLPQRGSGRTAQTGNGNQTELLICGETLDGKCVCMCEQGVAGSGYASVTSEQLGVTGRRQHLFLEALQPARDSEMAQAGSSTFSTPFGTAATPVGFPEQNRSEGGPSGSTASTPAF